MASTGSASALSPDGATAPTRLPPKVDRTIPLMRLPLRSLALALAIVLIAAGCGGDDGSSAAEPSGPTDQSDAQLVTVSADEAAVIHESPPDGMVVLDVRTPEEFAAGRLEGATMIDFYAPDFADQLAQLDGNTPYLLYCRSGNRSGQTLTLMRQMGFTDVTEIDGGIAAWQQAGLPVTGS